MLTLRQIERFWNDSDFPRLARELLNGRVEFSLKTLADYSHRLPVAALAVIRIDEFGQSFHPAVQNFLRVLISAQNPDGSWGTDGGDPAITALVLRALSTGRGQGVAIERGVIYLTQLQKADGMFPRVPIGRTDGDEFVTALTLHHLAQVPAARGRLIIPAFPAELPAVTRRGTSRTPSAVPAKAPAGRVRSEPNRSVVNQNKLTVDGVWSGSGGQTVGGVKLTTDLQGDLQHNLHHDLHGAAVGSGTGGNVEAGRGSAKASTSEEMLSTRRLLRTLTSVSSSIRGPIPPLPVKNPVHTKLVAVTG